MKYLIASSIVAATLLVSGCANKNMQTKESGFLNNYDKLEKQDNMSKAKAYISPSADFSKYKNIYIEPVKIITGIPRDEQTDKQKIMFMKMQDYLTSNYIDIIEDSTNFNVVKTKDNKNTMIFESAISAVEVHSDDLSGMDFMPMMLVVKMITRPSSEANVRLLAESKLSDASTKEVLVQMLELHKGEKVKVDADELEFKDIQVTLDDLMLNIKDNIVRLRRGIVKYQDKKDDK